MRNLTPAYRYLRTGARVLAASFGSLMPPLAGWQPKKEGVGGITPGLD